MLATKSELEGTELGLGKLEAPLALASDCGLRTNRKQRHCGRPADNSSRIATFARIWRVQPNSVERKRNCDNLSALAQELGVDRTVYYWRNPTPTRGGVDGE